VIAPDGKILVEYTDLNPDMHVQIALAAVKKWREKHPL
jgi:peroxiredoxin